MERYPEPDPNTAESYVSDVPQGREGAPESPKDGEAVAAAESRATVEQKLRQARAARVVLEAIDTHGVYWPGGGEWSQGDRPKFGSGK